MEMATERAGVIERASKPTLSEFTAESFQPYIGATFVFHRAMPDGSPASDSAELELLEVSNPPGGSRNRDPRWRQPFSLLFVLRQGSLSTNGLCRMLHGAFEPSDLLLSRVEVRDRPASQQYYEAVFG